MYLSGYTEAVEADEGAKAKGRKSATGGKGEKRGKAGGKGGGAKKAAAADEDEDGDGEAEADFWGVKVPPGKTVVVKLDGARLRTRSDQPSCTQPTPAPSNPSPCRRRLAALQPALQPALPAPASRASNPPYRNPCAWLHPAPILIPSHQI